MSNNSNYMTKNIIRQKDNEILKSLSFLLLKCLIIFYNISQETMKFVSLENGGVADATKIKRINSN